MITPEVQSIYLISNNRAITWIFVDENEISYVVIEKEMRGTDPIAMEHFCEEEINTEDVNLDSIVNLRTIQPFSSSDMQDFSGLPFLP